MPDAVKEQPSYFWACQLQQELAAEFSHVTMVMTTNHAASVAKVQCIGLQPAQVHLSVMLMPLQLEGLDLVNCLIAPLFFANTLAMWTRGLLSAVYCAVLLLKGYQMGLLLLPGARQVHAHRKARCATGMQPGS